MYVARQSTLVALKRLRYSERDRNQRKGLEVTLVPRREPLLQVITSFWVTSRCRRVTGRTTGDSSKQSFNDTIPINHIRTLEFTFPTTLLFCLLEPAWSLSQFSFLTLIFALKWWAPINFTNTWVTRRRRRLLKKFRTLTPAAWLKCAEERKYIRHKHAMTPYKKHTLAPLMVEDHIQCPLAQAGKLELRVTTFSNSLLELNNGDTSVLSFRMYVFLLRTVNSTGGVTDLTGEHVCVLKPEVLRVMMMMMMMLGAATWMGFFFWLFFSAPFPRMCGSFISSLWRRYSPEPA